MLDLLMKNWKLIFLFVSFFHVICNISNFDLWTTKHLVQASCTELTLNFTSKLVDLLFQSTAVNICFCISLFVILVQYSKLVLETYLQDNLFSFWQIWYLTIFPGFFTASAKNSKIHAGTSSLGRNSKWPRQQPPLEAIETSPPTSPTSSGNLTTVSPPTSSPCTCCRSPSQFPKTNGSLYESLSLGRRCHCEKRSLGGQQRSLRPSTSSAESQDGGTGILLTLTVLKLLFSEIVNTLPKCRLREHAF